MKIDPKDLVPITSISEFQVGGIFYRKDDKEFFSCSFSDKEIEQKGLEIQSWTLQYIKEGRLFRSRNNPWKRVN
jgi:hypothetical protein